MPDEFPTPDLAVRDRKVVTLVNHWDRERALAELGIED
jgi:hypothetical protein